MPATRSLGYDPDMATIVRVKKTGETGILVGTGFGAFKSARPGFWGGDLFPDEKQGFYQCIALSNAEGEIGWFKTTDTEVVSVDGKTPREILEE